MIGNDKHYNSSSSETRLVLLWYCALQNFSFDLKSKSKKIILAFRDTYIVFIQVALVVKTVKVKTTSSSNLVLSCADIEGMDMTSLQPYRCSKDNETAAMSVYQTNPVGVRLFLCKRFLSFQ